MSRFDDCLSFVLRWEGTEFTDDPVDRGGATRYGITQTEFDEYLRGFEKKSVREINRDQVRDIYLNNYWTPAFCPHWNPPLDLVMLDMSVLEGVSCAIHTLQLAVDVPADGRVGPVTMAAVGQQKVHDLVKQILARRDAHFRTIVKMHPSQRKFLHGWLNRVADLRRVTGV